MIVGEVPHGEEFFLPLATTSGRWFRKVGHILHKAGIQQPDVLPDAVCGLATRSHQNADVVQDMRTGQFCFIDCNVTCLQPTDEEIEEWMGTTEDPVEIAALLSDKKWAVCFGEHYGSTDLTITWTRFIRREDRQIPKRSDILEIVYLKSRDCPDEEDAYDIAGVFRIGSNRYCTIAGELGESGLSPVGSVRIYVTGFAEYALNELPDWCDNRPVANSRNDLTWPEGA